MKVNFIMKSPEMALEFVKFSSEFVDDIELKNENISVDGKSILGVLSIGFPIEVEVIFHSDNPIALRLFDAYITKLLNDYEVKQDD